MNATIRELLQLLVVVGVALAILLGALLLDGCGASRPEVRRERRVTAPHILRSAAAGVDLASALCPTPVPACPAVRRVGRELAAGLRSTALAIEARTPLERAGCVAPRVSEWIVAAIEARRTLAPELVERLDRALDYLPDCPVPDE